MFRYCFSPFMGLLQGLISKYGWSCPLLVDLEVLSVNFELWLFSILCSLCWIIAIYL